MTSPIFKKTLFISLLGHLTVFTIFSFSFGDRIPKADFATVSFWGAILRSSDLVPQRSIGAKLISSQSFNVSNIKGILMRKSNISLLDKRSREYPLIPNHYLKPAVNLVFNQDKIIFREKSTPLPAVKKRKEQVIMFYPLLPYHFLLYFKDRQAVHIELMFNIAKGDKTNSIAIKRKISSGNLEADLLTMRYISHYLFIEQARFVPNNWQTVKIDLSTKDEK